MLETIIASLLLIVVGVLLLFVGYMFFRMLLPIVGLLAGFVMGAGAVSLLLGDGFLATLTGIVVGFIFALVIAVLSYPIYSLGVVILGASIGALLTGTLLVALGMSTGSALFVIIVLLAAAVFGVFTFALRAQKFLVIVLTAVSGTSFLILAVLLLFGRIALVDVGVNDPVQQLLADSVFWFIVWLMLSAFGIAVQTSATKMVELDVQDYALSEMSDLDAMASMNKK